MKEHNLKQILKDIGEQEVSSDIDLWPNLEVHLMKNPGSNKSTIRLPATRLSWITLIVLAFLLISSVAYALSPTLRRLIQMDVGLSQVESTGLGHPLNVSQTNEDVTVTLAWGYADENRVAVGYVIETGSDKVYEPKQFTLTDQQGQAFNPTAGLGATGGSAVAGAPVPPVESDYVFSFATPPITGKPDALNLNLELVLTSVADSAVTQPFNFNFSLPYTPGRVAEPMQSVTFNDITVSLEKVVVTPSDLTAVICFEPPDNDFVDWLPISQISAGGDRELMATVGTQRAIEGTNCTTNGYFPSLYEAEGVWQLTVTELVGFKNPPPGTTGIFTCPETEINEYCPQQLRIQGEWVFEFEMP